VAAGPVFTGTVYGGVVAAMAIQNDGISFTHTQLCYHLPCYAKTGERGYQHLSRKLADCIYQHVCTRDPGKFLENSK
jgi:hypothetical protein